MNKGILIIASVLFFAISVSSQAYPENEDGQYEDMLTPEYYTIEEGGAFRQEVNKFIHYARLVPFQHPLQDTLEAIPSYTVKRSFGDGLGPNGTSSHHAAMDMYLSTSTPENLYAAHDGMVSVNRDVDRYRHYLSITTDVQDSLGHVLGKMVTIYAHIELDLDTASQLNLDGQYVKKGDLVSKHLYSGTMGGAHLHFEVRYYRTTDTGFEDFYGGNVGDKTVKSNGSWSYGYWNPVSGYGFSHPLNLIPAESTSIEEEGKDVNDISIYPNPTKDILTLAFDSQQKHIIVVLFDVNGQMIKTYSTTYSKFIEIDLSKYPPGTYVISITSDNKVVRESIIKL